MPAEDAAPGWLRLGSWLARHCDQHRRVRADLGELLDVSGYGTRDGLDVALDAIGVTWLVSTPGEDDDLRYHLTVPVFGSAT